MDTEIFEIDKKYMIVYDDKGFKPIRKDVYVIAKDNNLIKVKSSYGLEILNSFNIVRAEEMRNGGRDNKKC